MDGWNRRAWAVDILEAVGLDPALLPSLVDAGTRVGALRDDELGLPLGIDVIAGGGDTQLAATGAGGPIRKRPNYLSEGS